MVTEHNLTGVEHSSEHPALGETHRHSSASVVQQDLGAARPSCRRRAHGVVVTPVSNQYAIIILRVNLREERGQRSVSLPVKRGYLNQKSLSSCILYGGHVCLAHFYIIKLRTSLAFDP